MVFADPDDFADRRLDGLVRPAPEPGDQDVPVSPLQYPLPAVLGFDMYVYYARALPASQRITAIDSLVSQPGLWRTEFA